MVLAGFAVLLLGYAWAKGGEQPLHEIREPVAVPGGAQ